MKDRMKELERENNKMKERFVDLAARERERATVVGERPPALLMAPVSLCSSSPGIERILSYGLNVR